MKRNLTPIILSFLCLLICLSPSAKAESGHVYAMGCNLQGQLGINPGWLPVQPSIDGVIKMAGGGNHTIALNMTALEILFDCQIKPHFTAFA